MSEPHSTSNQDAISNQGDPIACAVSSGFADWLPTAGGSVAITTYQAGKLVLVSWDGKQVSILPRQFDKPMGLAADGDRLALATRHQIWLLANAPLLARDYLEDSPGRYDALFLPRASYYTGDLNVHDVAFAGDGLCFVASRFSCLASLSQEQSFVPRWRPKFISEVVPEDRCHLNGLALVNGRPKFVTALGESDTVGGWRPGKADGGILIDVESGEVIHRGLSMPHSPRWYDGHLWFLNSGRGELRVFDHRQGKSNVVCTLPAYLRGLAFVGPYALVGLCQIRERHIFGGLPVQQSFGKLLCGVALIDLRTGNQVGLFEFTSGCQEIYDVQFLPKVHRPMVLNLDSEAARQAFTAPQFAYWLRPSSMIPPEVNESKPIVPPSGGKPTTGALSSAATPTNAKGKLRVEWEGLLFGDHSYCVVNRELGLALVESDSCELTFTSPEPGFAAYENDWQRFRRLVARWNTDQRMPADMYVSHTAPPNFKPPASGHWVLIRPLEYGSMPVDWLPVLNDQVDEVWAYSNYIRDCFVDDGVPADRVAVVPLGVHPRQFRPDAPPLNGLAARTSKRFKFLFVGGTIWRKGFDRLLEAYNRAFQCSDDVTLIVKELGARSFYQGGTHTNQIRQCQSNPCAPEIIYLTETLSDAELPGLYTACDCLVHPYRAEGFALPVAEAMACGLPVIITRGGAADDFTNEQTCYYIGATRKAIETPFLTVHEPWVLEPNLDELVDQMRWVVNHSAAAQACGRLASQKIRSEWTWQHSAEQASARLLGLSARPIRRDVYSSHAPVLASGSDPR